MANFPQIGFGVQFIKSIGTGIVSLFNWGTSTPTKVWGTATTETWG
jgi:hypothetical protein